MTMQTKELKNLKINATRINSFLVKSNNKFRKLRLEENTFVKKQEEREKKSLKEKFLEKSSSFKKSLTSIKDKIISGPMSIFDKVKEFFAVILIGFLINSLPKLIEKMKKFFNENPEIINGIKETFKILGDWAYGLITIVNSLTPEKQQKLDLEREQVNEGINSLDNEVNIVDRLISNLFKIFGSPNPQKNSPRISNIPPKEGTGRGGPSDILIPSPSTPSPQPPAPFTGSLPSPQIKPQGFSRGGTVQSSSQNTKNKLGTSSQVDKTKVTSRVFSRSTAKGRKARETVNSFRFFKNNTLISSQNLNQQTENNKSLSELSDNVKTFTKMITGKNKIGDVSIGDNVGIPKGGEVVQSESSDFWLLSLISLYENSNPQGAADVAQSIYNRMSNRGQTARQVILAENQYQPVRKFGGYAAWGQVVDRETAIAHIRKYPGNSVSESKLDVIAKALLDKSMQSEAAKFVGILPDFRNKAYESENDEMTDDKSRHNHTFGFNRGGSRGKITKPASIPTFVEGNVITEYTPSVLTGENTAFQGTTGKSTGPHLHIGPLELLDSKTLAYVGTQTESGKRDARLAAFRVVKALIARKTRFAFSNLNINKIYDPSRERLTDKNMQELILAEQNAHVKRQGSGSWGGIDIVLFGATDIPIPVGKVVYHPDGFGYRAHLLGTKGFVGHLAKGSTATPISQIQKPEVTPKVEPIIKQSDLDKLKTVINSKPGSGQEVKIPGVGTYIRGRNVLGMAEDKYFDENGDPISKDEFYKKLEEVKGNSNQVSTVGNSVTVAAMKRGDLRGNDSGDNTNTIIAYAVQPIVNNKTTTKYVPGKKEYVYVESDTPQDISSWEIV